MIHVVFGVHGLHTKWCCEVIGHLLGTETKELRKVELNSVEDLTVRLLKRETPLIVASRRPEQQMIDAVHRAGLRYVVAADNPRRSVRFRTAETGDDRVSAIRDVLAELAALHDLSSHPQALFVSRDTVVSEPILAVASIADHFGLPRPDASDTRDLLREAAGLLDDGDIDAPRPAPDEGSPGLGLPGRRAVLEDTTLESLGTGYEKEPANQIVVTREFFNVIDGEPGAALRPIDATGRARWLVNGPFVCLPAGDWVAQCVHRYSQDLASASFAIDVVHFAGGVLNELARTSFKVPSGGGVVETLLQFRVDDPRSPLETRLVAERAIFSGEIMLGYVQFRRASPPGHIYFPT